MLVTNIDLCEIMFWNDTICDTEITPDIYSRLKNTEKYQESQIHENIYLVKK
jgi:hypothetical protein